MKLFTLISLMLTSFFAHAQFSPAQEQYLLKNNLLVNPGFEQGKSPWASGAGTLSQTSANGAPEGTYAGCVTLSAQTLDVTISSTAKAGVLTGQGVALAEFRAAFTGVQMCATVAGVVQEGTCTTATTSILDSWGNQAVAPFIFGATSHGLKFRTAAPVSGLFCTDAGVVGRMPATMTPEVAQAQLAFEGYFPTTAGAFTSDSSTSFVTPATVAAIPGPTVLRQGVCQLQTTDSNRFEWTANNCPAGQYTIRAGLYIGQAAGSVTCFRITDGTTNGRSHCANSSATTAESVTVEAIFDYASSGNRTFTVQISSSVSSVNIDAQNSLKEIRFVGEYTPPASKVYSQPNNDQETWIPFTPTGTWTTNTTYTGKYRRVGDSIDLKYYIATSGAPSSGTLYVNLPTISGSALVIDTTKINFQSIHNTFLSTGNIRDTGATNFMPVYASWDTTTRMAIQYGSNAASITPTTPMTWANGDSVVVEVSGIPIVGWTSSQITGTFKDVVVAPGMGKPKQFSFNLANSSTQTAPCTASPCTVNSNNGGVVTGITRTSGGLYVVAMSNLASAELMCFHTVRNFASGSTIPGCYMTVKSQTSMTWQCTSGAGTVMDSAVDFQCQGQAP